MLIRIRNLFFSLSPPLAGVTSLLAQSNNRPSAEQYQQAAQAHFQQQLRLANAGDPAAQFTLADMYRNGVGTEVNDTEARQWIEKSAHGGYLEAMLTLADELNRDQKYSDAVVWFRKAAEKGDTRGKAEFWLGVYYEEGDGVLNRPAGSLPLVLESGRKKLPGGHREPRDCVCRRRGCIA